MNESKKIKELRKATGLSQRAFARLINSSARNIENWEAGYCKPPPYVIFLLEFWVENFKGVESNESKN